MSLLGKIRHLVTRITKDSAITEVMDVAQEEFSHSVFFTTPGIDEQPESVYKKKPDPKDYLEHYGMPRRSGRYPYGSGEDPYQHESFFKGFGDGPMTRAEKRYEDNTEKFIKELRKKMTDAEIAKEFGEELGVKTAKDVKAKLSTAKSMAMAEKRRVALELMDRLDGNQSAVAREMSKIFDDNIPESSVRSFLKDDYLTKRNATEALADRLKERVDEKGYVDIGEGSEHWVSATQSKLDTAARMLQQQGYVIENINHPQVTNSKGSTTIKVLARPGEDKRSIWANRDKLSPIVDIEINEDVGNLGLKHRPESLDSKRLQIAYKEDGGSDRDGMIEVRRGVQDLSLGDSKYAQSRIVVDDKYYLKGVAVYSDNLPPGVDVRFNTSHSKTEPMKEVLKPLKVDATTGEIDWNNPFGATIKARGGQLEYTDKNGKERVGLVNKVTEEGDWNDWRSNNKVATQFVGKQPIEIARDRIELTKSVTESKFESLMSLTNPVVKKKMLEDFADKCDTESVDMQVSAFPRQSAKLILSAPSLKENEVYAPGYEDGEEVIAVRYPLAHVSEIPRLVVNNSNKEARTMLGNAPDAVAIHPSAAARMSGADFDGDTALIIPTKGFAFENNNNKQLKELVGWDNKEAYPPRYDANGNIVSKIMPKEQKGKYMGIVSNLITDMTAQKAPLEEIARALKHSMVVIDAPKHKLDWQKSLIDNGIEELQKKYQNKSATNPELLAMYPFVSKGGASTLLSLAKSDWRAPERKEGIKVTDPETGKTKYLKVDPETGEKLYTTTNRKYPDKKGKEKDATDVVEALSYVKDAHVLSTGTPMEEAYADFSNYMKSMGNRARKEALSIKMYKRDPEAEKAYAAEVASLKAKVLSAEKESPKERLALIYAAGVVDAKIEANPALKSKDSETKKEVQKIKNQAMTSARMRYGKEKRTFDLTDKEVEAINAHAIAPTVLEKVLRFTDSKSAYRQFLPKDNYGITPKQISLILKMGDDKTNPNFYPASDIAASMNLPVSVINKVLSGEIK